LIFFARAIKDKGIFDLFEAVSMLKKKHKNISLCVSGAGNYNKLKHYLSELEIMENVTLAGFLPTQEEFHKLVSRARISVLPTYHDIISRTILESLFLKIPLVAYDVGSIHEVNKGEGIISLVEKQNIPMLAKSIEFLLYNHGIRRERAENGWKRANELFIYVKWKLQKV